MNPPFPTSKYIDGVLFASGGSKGQVLKEFIKQNNLHPTSVRMVDDKLKNLNNIGPEMDNIGMPFTGYRYGAADGRVKSFDHRISDVQLKHFNRTGFLLSDKEAKKLVK